MLALLLGLWLFGCFHHVTGASVGHSELHLSRSGAFLFWVGGTGINESRQFDRQFMGLPEYVSPSNTEIEPRLIPILRQSSPVTDVLSIFGRKMYIPKEISTFDAITVCRNRLARYIYGFRYSPSYHSWPRCPSTNVMYCDRASYIHLASRRLPSIANVQDRGDAFLGKLIFRRAAVQVSPDLSFAKITRYNNGIVSGSYCGSGRFQCLVQQPYCPSAQEQRGNARDRHYPLGEAITPKEAVIRAAVAIFSGVAIMFGFGWLSWRGEDSRLRLYGWLMSGLMLSGSVSYSVFWRYLLG
jgi:hypothetical protein